MTTAEIKEIAERIADAKMVLARTFASGATTNMRLAYAKDLYCEAFQGGFRSSGFYFELQMECLKAAGLELAESGQGKLL